jgi:hypothetical protein
MQTEVDLLKEVDEEYMKLDFDDPKIQKSMDENDDPTNKLFPNEKYTVEQVVAVLEYWRQYFKNEIDPAPKQRARLFYKHLSEDRYIAEVKPKGVIVVTEMMALHVYGLTRGRLTCPVGSTVDSFERASPAMQRIGDFLKDHYNLGQLPSVKIPFSRPLYTHLRAILEAHVAPVLPKPKPLVRTNTPSLSRSSSAAASPSINPPQSSSSNNINLPYPDRSAAAPVPARNRQVIVRSVQDMTNEINEMDIEDRVLGVSPSVQPNIPVFQPVAQQGKRERPKPAEDESDEEYEDEDEKKNLEKRKKKKAKAEK